MLVPYEEVKYLKNVNSTHSKIFFGRYRDRWYVKVSDKKQMVLWRDCTGGPRWYLKLGESGSFVILHSVDSLIICTLNHMKGNPCW